MIIKKKLGERIFDITNVIILFVISLVCLYPMIYVLFASFSDPVQFIQWDKSILLKPLGFSFEGYKALMRNPNIISGYSNTFYYVVVGTLINMLMTSFGAYVISHKNLLWKKPLVIFIIFTMYFQGGLIPSFVVVNNLGLYDTRWAILLPYAILTWNLIVLSTGFKSVPDSLIESAKIDGANDFTILFRIVIPTCMASISVILLFYAVWRWNEWFSSVIYLRNRSLFPLQLILREILINQSTSSISQGADVSESDVVLIQYILKYAAIIISTIPILLVYPFLQRYFVKGVMVGSLKE